MEIQNMNLKMGRLTCILILVVLITKPLPGEQISIPGDTSWISYYSKYFYNFPDKDFLYHLNDRLLFKGPLEDNLELHPLRVSLANVI